MDGRGKLCLVNQRTDYNFQKEGELVLLKKRRKRRERTLGARGRSPKRKGEFEDLKILCLTKRYKSSKYIKGEGGEGP